MFTVLLATAMAQTLVHDLSEGTERAYKIDGYTFGARAHHRGEDWRPPVMEHLSFVATCTVTGELKESCTLHEEGLWYGIVTPGSESAAFARIPFGETIELTRTSRGRIRSTRVRGKAIAFHEAYGQYAIAELYQGHGTVPAAAAIGEEGLQEVVRLLGAGLELELPKKDLKGKTRWRGTRALRSGRLSARESEEAARSVNYTLSDEDGLRRINWDSEVEDMSVSGPEFLGAQASVTGVGSALFDDETGRLLGLTAEIKGIRGGVVEIPGPTRRTVISVLWTADESTDPGLFPRPTLP